MFGFFRLISENLTVRYPCSVIPQETVENKCFITKLNSLRFYSAYQNSTTSKWCHLLTKVPLLKSGSYSTWYPLSTHVFAQISQTHTHSSLPTLIIPKPTPNSPHYHKKLTTLHLSGLISALAHLNIDSGFPLVLRRLFK